MGCNSVVFGFGSIASSETQRQIVGARESLNGRKKWREQKSRTGGEPWGQCFTRPVPDSQGRSCLSIISHTSGEKILLVCHQYEHKDHMELDVIC